MSQSKDRLWRTATGAVAGALGALLNRDDVQKTVEGRLVIDAVRRAYPDLASASVERIHEYVGELSPESARGFFNNLKGVYHELLVTKAENIDGDPITAKLHEALNAPGSDIVYTLEGETVKVVQVKATENVDYIRDHLDQYPDIAVIATSEVATSLENVSDSGHSNQELERDIRQVIGDDPLLAEIPVGAMTPLMAVAINAGHLLRSGCTPRQFVGNTLKDVAVAAGSFAVVDLLLG